VFFIDGVKYVKGEIVIVLYVFFIILPSAVILFDRGEVVRGRPYYTDHILYRAYSTLWRHQKAENVIFYAGKFFLVESKRGKFDGSDHNEYKETVFGPGSFLLTKQ
jgi:hypothetical protein